MPNGERLPADLAANFLLVHQLGDVITDILGTKACRSRGIGKLRRRLSEPLPANMAGEARRAQNLCTLERHCRLCGRCALSRE